MLRHLFLLCASLLLCCTFASAYTPNEQALLQFAETLTNFDDVYLHNNWTGWGRDDSALCPSIQTDVVDSTLCQPEFPGGINASRQSWTGVVCTPNDTVLCLSLPSWNLTGSISALEALAPLEDLQVLNLANNSLRGSLPASLPHDILNATATGVISLSFVYLSNNSISGTLPALWGDNAHGWQQSLQGLYLDQNELTGQLPQSWSDSDLLLNMGRMDFFLNQLSGPLTWNAANMPNLGNLVLLPGNEFCGTIPTGYEGIVRSYSAAVVAGTQILPNVTQLGRACSKSSKRLSHGAIAGGVIAAVAGALMAAFLCYICFRQVTVGSSKTKPAAAKPGWLWSFRSKRQKHLHESQDPAYTASKLESLPSSSSDINLLSTQSRSHVQAPYATPGQLSSSAV